jgi:hypothetical protein
MKKILLVLAINFFTILSHAQLPENRVASKSHQEPWMQGSFEDHFCFPSCGQIMVSQVSFELTESQKEDNFWSDTKAAGNIKSFEAYLKKYPKGQYIDLANAHIDHLNLNMPTASCLKDKSVDTLISFATVPGSVSSDGIGRNGLYTEVLINELYRPNAIMHEILMRISISVNEKSKGVQIPWSMGSMSNDCFNRLYFTEALKKYPNKFAVILGNSNYTKIAPLRNSINDSNDVKQFFLNQNFITLQKNNFTFKDIRIIFREIKKQLSRDAVFVFYYAGHAVEINGENYFLPVDAEINNEADVKENSLRLRDLIEVVNSTESNFNLYFVDASRDNPFARTAIGR